MAYNNMPRFAVGEVSILCPACGESVHVVVMLDRAGYNNYDDYMSVSFQEVVTNHRCNKPFREPDEEPA